MKKYRVKEIFGPTLQGEGPYTGISVYFVRLSNCNKWNGRQASKANSVCFYCDTDFVGGDILSAAEIVSRLRSIHTGGFRPHVVISGGEPMLQVDHELLEALSWFGNLHIETNGSIDIPEELADYFCCITVSPKQPASETQVREAHAFKFLYPWVKPEIRPDAFEAHRGAVYIQPIDGPAYAENLQGAVNVCLANPSFRLSLQTHKILNIR